MRFLRHIARWFALGRLDAELAEELEHHRALTKARFEADGMAAAEAEHASQRAMGNVTLAREDARDVWVVRWADQLWRDVTCGARGLRHEPVLAFAAILTLAIGIATTTTAFSVADAELWRPLPFPDSENLTSITWRPSGTRQSVAGISGPDLIDWRGAADGLAEIARGGSQLRQVLQLKTAESVAVLPVTANFFTTLRRGAIEGRTFNSDDPAGEQLAVVTDRALARLFGGDLATIGRTVMVDDVATTIIGVVAADAALGQDPDLYVPLDERSAPFLDRTQPLGYTAIARLAPGVSRDQLRAALQTLADRTAETPIPGRDGLRIEITDLRDEFSGHNWRPLYFFAGASLIVLLLCAANVAALLVSRAMRRSREFALRGALGGGTGALTRQLLVEGALLAVPGGLLGVLLTFWLLRLLLPLLPSDSFGRIHEIPVDLRVCVFSIAATAVSTLIFALVPLPLARRVAAAAALREGGRSGASRADGLVRNVLLTLQISLTVVLLAGAAIFLKSFVALTRMPLGFEPTNVAVLRVTLSGPRYESTDAWRGFADRIEQQVRQVPGVRSVALATSSPLASGAVAYVAHSDRPAPPPGEDTRVIFRAVTPQYFSALGIGIRRGRAFSAADAPGAHRVAIVDETLAVGLFGEGVDPVGKVLDLLPRGRSTWVTPPGPLQIVGLIDDPKEVGFNEVPFAGLYVPLAQMPASRLEVIVRMDMAPATALSALRASAAETDPAIPITSASTLETRVDRALQGDRFNLLLVASFAIIALVLAAIGVYATTAYNIQTRTREFGIRLALGALPSSLVKAAIWSSGRLALVGALAGLVATLALARVLGTALYLVPGEHNGLLYGVTTTDPAMLAAALVGVLITTLVAAAIPTRQVARVDPVSALRAE